MEKRIISKSWLGSWGALGAFESGMTALASLALAAAMSSAAYADGFVCQVATGDLRVHVYNQLDPRMGTRNPAAMIVSNPLLEKGRRTIARFDSVTGLLTAKSAQYDAEVDLRFKGSDRKGESIGGTRLGYLDRIELDINFSFERPVDAGVILEGELTLVKRDGQKQSHLVSCERYLKGD